MKGLGSVGLLIRMSETNFDCIGLLNIKLSITFVVLIKVR